MIKLPAAIENQHALARVKVAIGKADAPILHRFLKPGDGRYRQLYASVHCRRRICLHVRRRQVKARLLVAKPKAAIIRFHFDDKVPRNKGDIWHADLLRHIVSATPNGSLRPRFSLRIQRAKLEYKRPTTLRKDLRSGRLETARSLTGFHGAHARVGAAPRESRRSPSRFHRVNRPFGSARPCGRA